MASSDVFVSPSETETFGSTVVEAQASGLPVVVASRGAAREDMIDEITGLVGAARRAAGARRPRSHGVARRPAGATRSWQRRRARFARRYAMDRGRGRNHFDAVSALPRRARAKGRGAAAAATPGAGRPPVPEDKPVSHDRQVSRSKQALRQDKQGVARNGGVALQDKLDVKQDIKQEMKPQPPPPTVPGWPFGKRHRATAREVCREARRYHQLLSDVVRRHQALLPREGARPATARDRLPLRGAGRGARRARARRRHAALAAGAARAVQPGVSPVSPRRRPSAAVAAAAGARHRRDWQSLLPARHGAARAGVAAAGAGRLLSHRLPAPAGRAAGEALPAIGHGPDGGRDGVVLRAPSVRPLRREPGGVARDLPMAARARVSRRSLGRAGRRRLSRRCFTRARERSAMPDSTDSPATVLVRGAAIAGEGARPADRHLGRRERAHRRAAAAHRRGAVARELRALRRDPSQRVRRAVPGSARRRRHRAGDE